MIDNLIFKKYPEGNIMQWFGENVELYKKSVCFGGQCLEKGHNGIDLVAPYGTPIKTALCDQKAVECRELTTGFGKYVKTVGELNGKTYEFTYGHLSEILIKVGDKLLKGQILGKMGNSGFVVSGNTPYWKYNPYAGTHLHFQIRELAKWQGRGQFISYMTGEQYEVLDYENGSFGAKDPMGLFVVKPETFTLPDITQLRLTIISLLNQIKNILRGKILERGAKPVV